MSFAAAACKQEYHKDIFYYAKRASTRNEILLSISVGFAAVLTAVRVHAVSLDYICGNENMGIFAI